MAKTRADRDALRADQQRAALELIAWFAELVVALDRGDPQRAGRCREELGRRGFEVAHRRGHSGRLARSPAR